MSLPFPDHLGITTIGSQTTSANITFGEIEEISETVGLRYEGGPFYPDDKDENGDYPCNYSGISKVVNNYEVEDPNEEGVFIPGSETIEAEFDENTCQVETTYTYTGACSIYSPDVWIFVDQPTKIPYTSPASRNCRNTSGGTGQFIINNRDFWTATSDYRGNESMSAQMSDITIELQVTNSKDATPITVQSASEWFVLEHQQANLVYNVSGDTYVLVSQTVDNVTTYEDDVITPYWGKHGAYESAEDFNTNEPFEVGLMTDIPETADEFGDPIENKGSYGGDVKITNHHQGNWRVTLEYNITILNFYTFDVIEDDTQSVLVYVNDDPVTRSFSTQIPAIDHIIPYHSILATKYEKQSINGEWVEESPPSCRRLLLESRRPWYNIKGIDDKKQTQVLTSTVSRQETAPRCGGGSSHTRVSEGVNSQQFYDKHGNFIYGSIPSYEGSVVTDAGSFTGLTQTDLDITLSEYLEKQPEDELSISNGNHTTERYTIKGYGFEYNGVSVNRL